MPSLCTRVDFRQEGGGCWLSTSAGTLSSRHRGLPAERGHPYHLSLAAFLMHLKQRENLGAEDAGHGLGRSLCCMPHPKALPGGPAEAARHLQWELLLQLPEPNPSLVLLPGGDRSTAPAAYQHQWVLAAACELGAAVPTSCALEQSTLSPALGHHIPFRSHRSLCPHCRASSAQSSSCGPKECKEGKFSLQPPELRSQGVGGHPPFCTQWPHA